MFIEEEKKAFDEEEEMKPPILKSEQNMISISDLKRLEIEVKYEIIEKLGEGGFGKVYKIKRISDGKLFAVKCISYKSIYYNSC